MVDYKKIIQKIILSFDGGGTRGLMEAIMLIAIENKLRRVHGDNVRIIDFVDVITGASTGGIIAALLSHPKRYTAEQVLEFYNKHCYEIFNESKKKFHTGLIDSNKYKVDKLERILKKYFGNLRMRDLKGHVIISAQNVDTSEYVFFSNKKRGNKILETYLVWEVLRATSAAPTYFKVKVLKTENGLNEVACRDGGMIANDMSICALAKVVKYNPKIDFKEIGVINIGSGAQAPKIKNARERKSIITVGKNLPLEMLYGNVNIAKYQCFNLLSKYYSLDIPKVYRNYSEDMADASNENMKKMRVAAIKTVDDKKEEIDSVVEYLSEEK